jgi:hypothetical protein
MRVAVSSEHLERVADALLTKAHFLRFAAVAQNAATQCSDEL